MSLNTTIIKLTDFNLTRCIHEMKNLKQRRAEIPRQMQNQKKVSGSDLRKFFYNVGLNIMNDSLGILMAIVESRLNPKFPNSIENSLD